MDLYRRHLVEGDRPLVKFLDFCQNWLAAHRPEDPVDRQGNTLLHLAILKNAHLALSLLRKYKLDPHKKNLEGFSSIDLITLLNREAFFNFLEGRKEPKVDFYPRGSKVPQTLALRCFTDMFKFQYIDHLEFHCADFLNWSIQKCKKRSAKASIQKENGWNLSLFRRELSTGRVPKISLRYVNPLVGYGIFSDEEISALTYVGEYTGLVRKRHIKSDRLNNFVFGYVIGPYDTPFVIDAKNKGNLMRFINHSERPNLTSRWLIQGGIGHVILFSNKSIRKGSQLTYDYGPLYWKKRSYPLDL